MKLSIVVPVYNEEKTIDKVIETLIDLDLGNWDKELIVVDDGSTDDTKGIVENFKFAGRHLLLLSHLENQGKGQAIKTALKHLTGDHLIIQDADLEYDPKDIAKLLTEVGIDKTLVVYGSRNLRPEREGYRHYVWGVWLLTRLFNFLYNTTLTDLYTCYKLLPVRLIKQLNLQSAGFEFEAEITAQVVRSGYKIKEVPIKYYPRKFREGKKIRATDGLKGVWTILKNRFKIITKGGEHNINVD